MAMQEITERVAAVLGGAQAAILLGDDKKVRIIWKGGLIQTDYRMGDMGCPKPLPNLLVAAQYLESLGEDGYFVTLRREP